MDIKDDDLKRYYIGCRNANLRYLLDMRNGFGAIIDTTKAEPESRWDPNRQKTVYRRLDKDAPGVVMFRSWGTVTRDACGCGKPDCPMRYQVWGCPGHVRRELYWECARLNAAHEASVAGTGNGVRV